MISNRGYRCCKLSRPLFWRQQLIADERCLVKGRGYFGSLYLPDSGRSRLSSLQERLGRH